MNKNILLNVYVCLALIPVIAHCSAKKEDASIPVPEIIQEIVLEKISDPLLKSLLKDFSMQAMINASEVEECWRAGDKKERGDVLVQLARAQAYAARALRELQFCRTELAKTQAELKFLKTTQPMQPSDSAAAVQESTSKNIAAK